MGFGVRQAWIKHGSPMLDCACAPGQVIPSLLRAVSLLEKLAKLKLGLHLGLDLASSRFQ